MSKANNSKSIVGLEEEEELYCCPWCNRHFITAGALGLHIWRSGDASRKIDTWHCSICGKSFKHRVDIRWHKQKVHNSNHIVGDDKK